jgi:hypothetical protein
VTLTVLTASTLGPGGWRAGAGQGGSLGATAARGNGTNAPNVRRTAFQALYQRVLEQRGWAGGAAGGPARPGGAGAIATFERARAGASEVGGRATTLSRGEASGRARDASGPAGNPLAQDAQDRLTKPAEDRDLGSHEGDQTGDAERPGGSERSNAAPGREAGGGTGAGQGVTGAGQANDADAAASLGGLIDAALLADQSGLAVRSGQLGVSQHARAQSRPGGEAREHASSGADAWGQAPAGRGYVTGAVHDGATADGPSAGSDGGTPAAGAGGAANARTQPAVVGVDESGEQDQGSEASEDGEVVRGVDGGRALAGASSLATTISALLPMERLGWGGAWDRGTDERSDAAKAAEVWSLSASGGPSDGGLGALQRGGAGGQQASAGGGEGTGGAPGGAGLPVDAQLAEGLGATLRHIPSPAGQRAVTIRLDPAELGKVRIQLRVAGEVVSVRFQVQTQQARASVERAQGELRQSIERRGLRIDSFMVEMAEDGAAPAGQAGVAQPAGRSDAVEPGDPRPIMHKGAEIARGAPLEAGKGVAEETVVARGARATPPEGGLDVDEGGVLEHLTLRFDTRG